MEIYVDNKILETDQKTSAPLNLALSSITDVATGKIPFSKTIKIPDTPQNRRVLGYSSEIFALERFNNARHPARIEQDGFTVMQGVAQLSNFNTTPTGRYFNLNLIGNEIEWITAASETPLADTDLGLPEMVLSDALVRESLNTGFPAPFHLIPVQKGKYIQEARDDEWRDRTQTMLSDYAPFFSLPALFRAVFAQAGYSVESAFIDSGIMAGLCVSGRWKQYDTDELDEKYGFLAGRFSGKEFKTLIGVDAEMLGPIVETADPEAENSDGDTAGTSDVYNHSGSFQIVNNQPIYVVPEDMTVGLKYSLHYYSTVHYELDGKGVKRAIWLKNINIPDGDGNLTWFDMTGYEPDFNKDARKTIVPSTEYYFTLSPTFAAAPSKGELYLGFSPLEKNEAKPKEPLMRVYHMLRLKTSDTAYNRAYLFEKIDGKYTTVDDAHWRLIELPEEIEVEANIHTQTAKYEKGSIIKLNTPEFFSHKPGEIVGGSQLLYFEFALSNDTTVATYFSPQATIGDAVNAANMLAFGETKQLDFIKGVRQLFNLYLYTDTPSQTVYVEPRDDFYSGPILDWTDKVDYSKEIEMEELGGDLGRNFVLSYKEGDPQVAARNESSKTKYAEFTTPILNTISKKEDYILSNEFFTPAIIKDGGCSGAKDAKLLQIGDPVDADNESPYERDMSFEPKIVKYEGLQALPSGQKWHYPDGVDTRIPVIAFQNDLINLGFDGEGGLNRYYRENIELYNHGRRLTMSLRLTPRDIEPFIILDEDKKDFRATILLKIEGENVLCKLEEIKDFDPNSTGPTKCVLTTG